MNSLSWRTMGLVPRNNFHHSQALPAAIRKTNATKAKATMASKRQMAAWRSISEDFVGSVRVAALRVSESAPLRKPSFGSAEKIFRQAALKVTAAMKQSGASVTKM